MIMAKITEPGGLMWLTYALMTVVFWGLYGIFLHAGQIGMADPVNGRYKSFLFVGLAYFLTAIVAPALVLLVKDASWTFPIKGLTLSLIAGLVGAAGAFCVLLAFGAKGSPASVMTIIFAGAPIVNAVVALTLHPPQGGFKSIPVPFFAGIVLAVIGSSLVILYKPKPQPHPQPTQTGTATDTADALIEE
jgi:drug/metabolite transporter (DMT)-like permease